MLRKSAKFSQPLSPFKTEFSPPMKKWIWECCILLFEKITHKKRALTQAPNQLALLDLNRNSNLTDASWIPNSSPQPWAYQWMQATLPLWHTPMTALTSSLWGDTHGTFGPFASWEILSCFAQSYPLAELTPLYVHCLIIAVSLEPSNACEGNMAQNFLFMLSNTQCLTVLIRWLQMHSPYLPSILILLSPYPGLFSIAM